MISIAKSLIRVSEMRGDSAADTQTLRDFQREAEQFLTNHAWCAEVLENYFGYGVPGVLGVFLMRIRPRNPEVNEWLWVEVGDLPPAYVVADGNHNPRAALDAYVEEMHKWVVAAEDSRSIEELVPVNVEPTLENAAALRTRLDFIRREILPNMEDARTR